MTAHTEQHRTLTAAAKECSDKKIPQMKDLPQLSIDRDVEYF